MTAFLIITSSSLVFYLGLLAVLYRDARKRRSPRGAAYKVQPGSVAELGQFLVAGTTAPSPRRRYASSVVVNFAGSTGRGKLKLQASQNEPAEVVTIPMFARRNNDLSASRSSAKGNRYA